LRRSRMPVQTGATADRRARSAPPATTYRESAPAEGAKAPGRSSRTLSRRYPASITLSEEQNLLAGPDGPLFQADYPALRPGVQTRPERGPAQMRGMRMLGWNKNKSDHPMADDRSAKQFLAELPTGDSFKLLEEVSFWLDSTRTAEGLKPLRAYEIVDQLDSAARPHQRKLAQEYLAGGNRRQRFQELRIWNSQVELCRQLGAAYEYCLTRALSVAPGSGALKPLTPMLACRAIRALTLELKWALLRYAPVDPTLWGRLGTLYAQAEKNGFVQKVCSVYAGMGPDSTVEREYLKALMLSISATDTLLPRKVEVAERIVADLCAHFTLSAERSAGCHYCVDLAVARPPTRLLAQAASAPTMRYFGPGKACEAAAKLIAAITSSGAIPSDLNLGGNYEPNLVIEILHHLSRYWAAMPPARAQERRRSFVRLHVV